MAANFWRVPAPVVKTGSAMSVIQDRGMLQHASTASNGRYLFTEVGAGVKPLALIGLWHEVLNFLARQPGCGIDNRIAELPDIYMGVCFYRPGQRFTGLFPVHDAIASITSQVVGIAGGGLGNVLPSSSQPVQMGLSAVNNLLGAVKDGKEALQPVIGNKPKPPNMKLASNEVYIKFGYLPESGMKRIGAGQIGFDQLHGVVRETLSAMA